MLENYIDGARAVALLQQVVERNEDYVYEVPAGADACVYVTQDGTPSCIVGRALTSVGVGFWRYNEFTGIRETFYMNGGIAGLSDELQKHNPGLTITNEARLIFAVAQSVQDNKGTWGVALQAARTARFVLNEYFQPPTA